MIGDKEALTTSFDLLLNRAKVVVKNCLKAESGEKLLLLLDETVSQELVYAFRAASYFAGAETQLLTFKPPVYTSMKEYSISLGVKEFSVEPPSVVSAAMREANATLLLTSDLSIVHSKTLKKVQEEGKRVIFIPYMTKDNFIRLMPSSPSEVERLRAKVEKGGQIFSKAQKATITSPSGTDIKMDIGQYETLLHKGVAEPGDMQILPAGQITRVPNDNSAEGILVIDRSIAAPEYKELTGRSITLRVSRSNLIAIEGGPEARQLDRFLKDLNDPQMYHITELSIGVNPKCKFSGIAAPAEDTHTLGSVNMALGCDVHLKGSVEAKAHIDMTMWHTTLKLDDRVIVDKGDLMF